jgi:CRISPR-associated protein Csm4
MQLYKTTVTPTANFGTPLKGDTLFGQLCWAIRYTLGVKRLEALLHSYDKTPFLTVSDGFAPGFFPKPFMPNRYLQENNDTKKSNRKKIWLSYRQLQNGDFNQAKTSKEAYEKAYNEDYNKAEHHNEPDQSHTVTRNSINYKTSSTYGEGFDPYGTEEFHIAPKELYFLIQNDFTQDELKTAFDFVAQNGYGKDTTIGKGRFEIGTWHEEKITNRSKTFLTLSPFAPQGLNCKELYYRPFTKFGRHSAELSNKNPFKKPLLLADSGAVIHYEKEQTLHIAGKALHNLSSHKSVHQGYSIAIPIKEITPC